MISFDKSLRPIVYLALAVLLVALFSGVLWKYKQSIKKDVIVEINGKEQIEIKEDKTNVEDASDNLPDDVFSGVQSTGSSEAGQVGDAVDNQKETDLLSESGYEIGVQEKREIGSGEGLSDPSFFEEHLTRSLHEGCKIKTLVNMPKLLPDCEYQCIADDYGNRWWAQICEPI